MSVLDSFRLDGRTAIVTGGAGLYGRQIVAALAEAGAKAYIASRDLKNLEKAFAPMRDACLDVYVRQLDQSAPNYG